MKNKFLFVALIILPLFFTSCSFLTGGVTFDEDNFEKEYALWKENNPKNYSFEYRCRSNSGGVLLRITVRDGISSFENLVDEMEVKNSKINSMEDVFGYIRNLKKELEELKESEEKDRVYEFSMSFDETYHYPTKVSIDSYRKKWWKDMSDELGRYFEIIEIKDFTILED